MNAKAFPKVELIHRYLLDKAVEIDAYPDRQDLSIDLVKIAKKAGCRISLGTDSHGPSQLAFIELGLASALAGGIKRERILSEAEWQAALTRLEKSHSAFCKAIAECSDDKLPNGIPVDDGKIKAPRTCSLGLAVCCTRALERGWETLSLVFGHWNDSTFDARFVSAAPDNEFNIIGEHVNYPFLVPRMFRATT